MKSKKSKPATRRRRHTTEFKREAVRLLETRGERTVADVAASIGVRENLLHNWRREFGDAAEAVRKERGGETAEDELKRLRRENAQLRQERELLKKIYRLLREEPELDLFELVETEKATFPVALICRLLGVSRSGYYSWRKASPSKRKEMNERLVTAIKVIHAEHQERYGSPRIHRELNAQGHGVGKHRVARLMRENGIKARTKRKFRHTTDSAHKYPVSPNLLEQRFFTTAPNQAWVGDITYIWTMEGWAYVAVLLDLYSRRVVGWALRKSLHRELALAALEMAITKRQPKRGLIHHSDRGSQYASADYRKVLRRHGLRSSMSAVGACWDNAVAESFFATLKKELVHRCAFQTRSEAYDAISDYIENYYNAKRRHSTNNYITPVAFELTGNPRLAA